MEPFSASKGVVLSLLKSYPESVKVKDHKGRTPLMLAEASASQNRDAVIGVIVQVETDLRSGQLSSNNSSSSASPDGSKALEVDYDHRTILFRLVTKKDWSGATQRSRSFPEEAATFIVTKGFNGTLRFLPLHKACVLLPPTDFISALIRAYPDGTKCTDQDGWLPLHCACFYGAEIGVICALVEAYPKAAQVKDDDGGRLPLHYACLKGSSTEVVRKLLSIHPRAALTKDDDGRLPLHLVCSKGGPSEIVEILLSASPKSAQTKDDQGRFPLHHARWWIFFDETAKHQVEVQWKLKEDKM